jgi:hypothetical protein
MKKNLIACTIIALSTMFLCSGCIIAVGNRGEMPTSYRGTLGQQLIDLQKAKEAGAINDAEYQAQKARLLDNKCCKK